MRLFEITGDDEDIVYNKLRNINVVINAYFQTPERTPELEKIFQEYINLLEEDPINLDYWIMTSERISKLYSNIKNTLKSL